MGSAVVRGMGLCLRVLVLAWLAAGCKAAPQTPPPSRLGEFPKQLSSPIAVSYARSMQKAPDAIVMETAARRFQPTRGSGPEVVLLGAVHIGAAAYYQELQQRMDAADLVLYEQVTDATRPPGQATPEQKAKRIASSAYQKLADLVGLTYQLARIDYDRPHFQRCDMTLQQMLALLETEAARGGPEADEARQAMQKFSTLQKMLDGDSWLLNFSMWMVGMNDAAKAQLRLRIALSGENRRAMDKQYTPRLARLIVEDRNAFVVEKLREVLSGRGDMKRVVVFYGAQHLPGIEKGLRRLGYTSAGPIEWLEAVESHPYAEGLSNDVVQGAIRGMHEADE